MTPSRRINFTRTALIATVILTLLASCGGGDEAAAPPPGPVSALPAYLLEYSPLQSPVYPAGTITVSPPQGRNAISDDGPVRVDLELAGFPSQRLDGPNFEPKYNPQLKYVFGLPQALAPDTHACVAAKVTVTSVAGVVSTSTFGVCAGLGLGLNA
jgi:hypothetical protein